MSVFLYFEKLESVIFIGIIKNQIYSLDKILNYSMFERKIRYSEEMITSREYLDKKSALDYIIDALQFILSVQDSEKVILKL